MFEIHNISEKYNLFSCHLWGDPALVGPDDVLDIQAGLGVPASYLQNTEYRIQNTEYRIQHIEYRLPGQTQITECRVQNTEKIMNTERTTILSS